MSTDVVRITSSITLEDLSSGRASPIEAYMAQVRSWIVGPGKYLAASYPAETDHGMALLAIELMFFEPHGRLLSKTPPGIGSKALFCRGFDRFRDYLRASGAIGDDTNGLPLTDM